MKKYKITIRTVHSALDIALGAVNTSTTYTITAKSKEEAERVAKSINGGNASYSQHMQLKDLERKEVA